jgi:hypothetical protein
MRRSPSHLRQEGASRLRGSGARIDSSDRRTTFSRRVRRRERAARDSWRCGRGDAEDPREESRLDRAASCRSARVSFAPPPQSVGRARMPARGALSRRDSPSMEADEARSRSASRNRGGLPSFRASPRCSSPTHRTRPHRRERLRSPHAASSRQANGQDARRDFLSFPARAGISGAARNESALPKFGGTRGQRVAIARHAPPPGVTAPTQDGSPGNPRTYPRVATAVSGVVRPESPNPA